MFLDRVLAFFGCNRIKSGVVVGKHDYPATDAVTFGGQVVNGAYQAQTIPAEPESYSLEVRGKGVFGGTVTQEVFVDALSEESAAIGSTWREET